MKTFRRSIGCLLALVAASLLLGACSELKDDLPAPAPGGAKVHATGWTDTSSSEFHGKYLKTKAWEDQECTRCHGGSYDGGSSGVACFTCHDSYPHAVRFSPQTGRHVGYLQRNIYPLTYCQKCHGKLYAGGPRVNVTCMKAGCHVEASGTKKSPESCNTCHGQFRAAAADLLTFAPPKSVAGDTATTVPGVGAHQDHLGAGTIGKTVKCVECHTFPAAWDTPGHITGGRARVVFNDTLATLTTGNGKYTPTSLAYDHPSLQCSNTYCHGNWVADSASSPNWWAYTTSRMVGLNASPVWTGGSSEAACGSCHALPPKGHVNASLSACSSCHGDVVDDRGNIVDKSKHINGKINALGQERNF